MAQYTLRVYPKGMSREASCVLACPSDTTLEELARHILYAFDFDDDHLYEFCMTCRLYDSGNYRKRPYGYDYDEDERSCDVRLDELGLYRGLNFWFHYDFGDDWVFVVHVNKVDDGGDGRVHLVSRKGHVEQYPSWDEDDDWDE